MKQSKSFGVLSCLTLLISSACVRLAPVAADSGRSPNEVIGVALVGSAVVARTAAYRVRIWTLETNSVVELDREHVVDMARDGSVVVSSEPFGEHGQLIEAWDPLTRKSFGTQRFLDGARVLAVSSTQVLVDADYPAPTARQVVQQMVPPPSRLVRWDIASGTLFELGPSECSHALISHAGRRISCDLQVLDIRTAKRFYPPTIAPDWKTREQKLCGHPKCTLFPIPEYHVNSSLFSHDDAAIYFTYSGRPEHLQSRLERWTIETPGSLIERLAATEAPVHWTILAVSHDQQAIVLGGRRQPLQLLRAPDFSPTPLAAGSANAATFSEDDTRLLTGHEDGHLRLWTTNPVEMIRVSP